MKKMLFVFVIGILFGVVGSISLYHALQPTSQPPQPPHPPSLQDVQQVAKLISIEYYMADVVSYQNNKIWPFSDQKILVIAKAKIMAGFNLLQGITVTIDEQASTADQSMRPRVKIALPPPQIIAIQPEYQYYDIKGNPPPDAHTYVLNLAKVSLWEAAAREGILEKAKTSVTQQMRQIFNNIDLEIYFQSTPQEVKNENS